MDLSNLEIATFAGGCFWCTEAIFKRVKGVEKVTSGYSGGDVKNPTYMMVATRKTNHAEAVQIEFDPKIITYEKLLEIFWATHDPTTLNKQGWDIGSEYRSAIFYHSDKQKEIAKKSKREHKKYFSDSIVTEVAPIKKFYQAEEYHQNYYENNNNSYCSLVISPKIQKLLEKFNNEVKDEFKNA
ncbi:peptide-methionine (S)-S-oxide reductase MsrA [Candidatus Daviesbacteria bacterium]|nr:peptide-methionine (S)-S-oxide reductase MsrA [Candidatus Daviesbacteria bacterium]